MKAHAQNSPCLQYKMYVFDSGPVDVQATIGSTLNFVPGRGLRYAISFDDQPPQVVDALEHNTQQDWEKSVRDNVRVIKTKLAIDKPGYHTLKFWMVDPAVALEKIVVDYGGREAQLPRPAGKLSRPNFSLTDLPRPLWSNILRAASPPWQ